MERVSYQEGELKWSPDDNNKFQNPESEVQFPPPQTPFAKPKHIFQPPEDYVKKIYTDGGSRILNTDQGKHYVGAWSYWCQEDDELRGKAEDNSTNNQMELMAVINALEYCNNLGVDKDKWVIICLDSDYVRFGILFWTKKWAKQGWVKFNAQGKPEEIKNLDLWKKLYELSNGRRVYYEKVKGHSGEEGNEKVDINCGLLMDEFIEKTGIKVVSKQ